jgi:hypothetical protein
MTDCLWQWWKRNGVWMLPHSVMSFEWTNIFWITCSTFASYSVLYKKIPLSPLPHHTQWGVSYSKWVPLLKWPNFLLEKVKWLGANSFHVTAPRCCFMGLAHTLTPSRFWLAPNCSGDNCHTCSAHASCNCSKRNPAHRCWAATHFWIVLTPMKAKVANRYERTGLHERMPVSQLALCLFTATGSGTLYGLNKQNQLISYVFWH